jgi:hypothetical protein
MIKNAMLNLLRLLTGQRVLVKQSTLDDMHRMRLASMRARRDNTSTDNLMKRLAISAKMPDPFRLQRETYGKVKAYLFNNDKTITGGDAVKNHAISSCCASLNITPPEGTDSQAK